MKVYELMNQLKNFPAGAEVVVKTIKTIGEMSYVDEDTYEICYPVQSVEAHYSISSKDSLASIEIDCY